MNASIVYLLFGLFFVGRGLYELWASPDEVFKRTQRHVRRHFGVEGGYPTRDFERRVRTGALMFIIMGIVFIGVYFAARQPLPSFNLTNEPTEGAFVTLTPLGR
ncbi:MAG: hypothetical protein SF123_21675 [Chloroflexota bacterium]|nr:hypothetical protein [Chloroflexota bacterium]